MDDAFRALSGRQSVSKHLAILEDASLVTSVRRGREKLHYLKAAPLSAAGQSPSWSPWSCR
jgi:DNA-binding transcriptional ArsR family regulator